jgi:hypothetical protein
MRGRGGVARKCLALQVASKMSKCEQDKRSKKSKILKDAYLNLNPLLSSSSVFPHHYLLISTKISRRTKQRVANYVATEPSAYASHGMNERCTQ